MARQKQRSQLTAIGEINMTPLIDLTFLLLIIFMITVPLLEYGVDVSPPEMDASPLTEEDSRIVDLNNRGEIVFDKQAISPQELAIKLEALHRINKEITVMVRADGDRPYREVNLMKTVKKSGVTNISLVTQAEN